MLKRNSKNRILCESGINPMHVHETIDNLLSGKMVPSDVPSHLVQSVISNLNEKRKNALISNKDKDALKIEKIIGELRYGPTKYNFDTPENQRLIRTRAMHNEYSSKGSQINETVKRIANEKINIQSMDNSTKYEIEPVMKTQRTKYVSKYNYSKARCLDHAIDDLIDYHNDSRRLGPRLLKVQALQRRLDQAEKDYQQAKEKCMAKRRAFNAVKKNEKFNFEHQIKKKYIDFDQQVPEKLPLEYSKFSGKVLEKRERIYQNAMQRNYEEADALRRDVIKREKLELEENRRNYVKSFTYQQKYIQKQKDQQREAFNELWNRKRDKNERDLQEEMAQHLAAVENLRRELANAQKACKDEIDRINHNLRISYTPLAGRAAYR